MHLKYRPEIDGLRALAVLGVVVFHAEFSLGHGALLEGGYLGVDVFFVLSGYLIASIILRETSADQFSLLNFYERRARRILPVLFTVVLATIPFAWWYLRPDALQHYAGSGLSALAFGSNFWFWNTDDYWADSSLLQPLLHTWSLAVEEQFYLLFPLLLLAFRKATTARLLNIIVLLLLASLLFAEFTSKNYPSLAFYMLPARGWELLAGVVLAILEVEYGRKSHTVFSNVLPGIGLVMIAWSMLYFDGSTQHPSALTLVPVVGTMLFIWFSRRGELATELLSTRPVVFVGLVSYGFYLWHYPVFAFQRITDSTLSNGDKTGLVIVSFVLSVVTYFTVERVLRNPVKARRSVFYGFLTICLLTIVAFMSGAMLTNGYESRLGYAAAKFKETERQSVFQEGHDCHGRDVDDLCLFETADATQTIINVGDSHADALGTNLRSIAELGGLNYLHASGYGCALVVGFSHLVDGVPSGGNCTADYNAQRLARIVSTPNAIVVYSGRLPLILTDKWFDNGEGGKEAGSQSDFMFAGASGPQRLKETLEQIAASSQHLYLVYPVPIAGWHVPSEVKRRLGSDAVVESEFVALKLKYPRGVFDEYARSTYEIYDQIDGDNITRIYPENLVCDDASCFSKSGERIFYQDTNHLTERMAWELVSQIRLDLQ